MATKLLYLLDFGVETCQAQLISAAPTRDNSIDLILDHTCFYPRGGGEDWEAGFIRKPVSAVEVTEVRLDEDRVVHDAGTPPAQSLRPGDDVDGAVNHDRRALDTRLRSAADVIDMAIDALG